LLASSDLSPKVSVLAIGKSAQLMAKAATEVLEYKHIAYSGYLLTKYGLAQGTMLGLTICEAKHPIPDANSLKHSKKIISWLAELPPHEDLIILLSGGGSALFEVPGEGYQLEDIIALNRCLLASGLSIAEMNLARSEVSQVKAGGALGDIASKRIFCYALSDVENNDPMVIDSAPFFHAQFQKISPKLYRYDSNIRKQQVMYHIVGDNLSFIRLLADCISQPVTIHPTFVSEPANYFADRLADYAKDKQQHGIHIFGGETPVQVLAAGKGGRCTHVALDFAMRIAGKAKVSLVAYATDGSDFLPGIAGAIVDGNTCSKLTEKGIDAEATLRNCDSYTALDAVAAIIPAFAKHINVNDIFILSL
ncbi:MAG: DUF4147 domain-containing protein, partial [Candidatus Cloacimonetes bacterium]|nr:DUF4147 domain-containing protein [Candidatus Cloacimonadota bacterium]